MAELDQISREPHPAPSLIRTDFPALYQSASSAARRGRRWYQYLVITNLGLLILVAILSALTFLLPEADQRVKGIFVASISAMLLLAMGANFINWHRADDKRWFDSRAVAELVKTMSWRYMMRTVPFEEDASSDLRFAERLRSILTEHKELRHELGEVPVDSQQITRSMRESRRLGVRRRRDLYIADRLDLQISWYRREARRNGQLAERWFWLSFGSEFIGLLIALSAIVFPLNTLDLVGVPAALAVAFTAWTQLGRHNELNKSYGRAWQELLWLKDLAVSVNSELALQTLVRDAEEAISQEHMSWIPKH